MKVEIEDGKYTYQLHPDGRSEVLRHGEPWRDTVGDKFIYCMASEIDELRQRVAELEMERDKATQYWQIAEGRCDALKQQRDDLLVAQQWQPINTAPKEGLFLVHRKHTAYPIVAHVYKPYGSICDYVFGELLHNVTHWMPLPPAPAIASVKEG